MGATSRAESDNPVRCAEAGEALGKSGDEGIDGSINEDRLGLDAIYLQAKRWEASAGRSDVQKFAGLAL
jgi:restriction system protein